MPWLDLEEEIQQLFTTYQTGNFIRKDDHRALDDWNALCLCAVCKKHYEPLVNKRNNRHAKALTCSDKCFMTMQYARHASVVNPYTPRPDKLRIAHEKMRTSMVAFAVERTCHECERGNALKSVSADVLQCKWCDTFR